MVLASKSGRCFGFILAWSMTPCIPLQPGIHMVSGGPRVFVLVLRRVLEQCSSPTCALYVEIIIPQFVQFALLSRAERLHLRLC